MSEEQDEIIDYSKEIAKLLKSAANWEDHLVPAPMCIAFLGQLMVVSTGGDFSLEDCKPVGGFSPIDNPKSFRACMQQVTNEGQEAFTLAHNNMDQICFLTQLVPGNIEKALIFIIKGSLEEIEDFLPIELKVIEEASKQCVTLAKDVEKKFNGVVSLVGKLLQVSLVAQGEYGKAEEIRQKMEDRKQALEQDEKMAKQWVEDTKKFHQKAEESYYDVMNELPSGWKKIAIQIFESLFVAPAVRRHTKEKRAKDLVESTRESHEKAQMDRKKISDDIQAAIEKLGSLNLSKIDFKETVDILLSGMETLYTLQKTWNKLVSFFQTTSHLISANLNVKLETICAYGNKTVELRSWRDHDYEGCRNDKTETEGVDPGK